MTSLYISVYYPQKLEQSKKRKINNIIQKYNNSYIYREIAEVLSLSECTDNNEYTLCGAIKLPYDFNILSNDMLEIQLEAVAYWVQCLNELYYLLLDSEWRVALDDIPLKWDSEIGWIFE